MRYIILSPSVFMDVSSSPLINYHCDCQSKQDEEDAANYYQKLLKQVPKVKDIDLDG